jgi:hypothetical protein
LGVFAIDLEESENMKTPTDAILVFLSLENPIILSVWKITKYFGCNSDLLISFPPIFQDLHLILEGD